MQDGPYCFTSQIPEGITNESDLYVITEQLYQDMVQYQDVMKANDVARLAYLGDMFMGLDHEKVYNYNIKFDEYWDHKMPYELRNDFTESLPMHVVLFEANNNQIDIDGTFLVLWRQKKWN